MLQQQLPHYVRPLFLSFSSVGFQIQITEKPYHTKLNYRKLVIKLQSHFSVHHKTQLKGRSFIIFLCIYFQFYLWVVLGPELKLWWGLEVRQRRSWLNWRLKDFHLMVYSMTGRFVGLEKKKKQKTTTKKYRTISDPGWRRTSLGWHKNIFRTITHSTVTLKHMEIHHSSAGALLVLLSDHWRTQSKKPQLIRHTYHISYESRK